MPNKDWYGWQSLCNIRHISIHLCHRLLDYNRSDGLLVDDTKEKAEILNRQYFSVFTPENTDEQLPPLNDNFQSMPEIKVTILGTEKLLKNLDPTKATGPDQIPARILKQFAAEFAPHLTTIFNTSITKGEVPTDWRQANVIPIFKKRGKVPSKQL